MWVEGVNALLLYPAHHEELLRFKELQKAVESRFGVEEEDWFRKVVFPAFAGNVTVIWPKDKETQDSGRS